jgi:hypothetical protein
MPATKSTLLLKPTLDTKFHIDYTWWNKSSEDLRMYLLSHLLPEQRERLSQNNEERTVDYVDPDTAEVLQLDELGLAIQIAAEDSNFINEQTSLVDSVFRVFLANGNLPMTPAELAERTGRSAQTILKTLSGRQIYKGIRPVNT